MNSFALFVLVAFGSEKGFAQIIAVDEVWSGEVVLTSEVQIDADVTLTIEPGSVVNGNGFGITSLGSVIANGTETNPIEFLDVRLVFEEVSEFSYLTMNGGGLVAERAGFSLSNSHLSDVDQVRVFYPEADTLIQKNIFERCGAITIWMRVDKNISVRSNVFVEPIGTEGAVSVIARYGSSTIDVQLNSFLSTDRTALAVSTDGDFDAPNNYFGTTDMAIINAMISDRKDTLTRPDVIQVEPILTSPHSSSAPWDSDGDGILDSVDTFHLDPFESADSDTDGIGDNADVFPDDPFEALDTDSDGIGNNADPDDDNDGFTDEEELADGTNPLSRFSCKTGCFSFDVDENLEAQPLTDGLLVIRHLFGFSGDSLTSGAVSGGASRDSSDAIASYLTDADTQLDIDGDGESKPLTDGLLLIRYLFGFSGDSLISGAIGSGATRDTAEAVEAYIKERVPAE